MELLLVKTDGQFIEVPFDFGFYDVYKSFPYVTKELFIKMIKNPVRIKDWDYFYCVNDFNNINGRYIRNDEWIIIDKAYHKVINTELVEEVSVGRYKGRPHHYVESPLW